MVYKKKEVKGRRKMLHVRLNKEELQIMLNHSESQGRPLSTMVREMVLEALE
jgi:predicted DNA-binding protein